MKRYSIVIDACIPYKNVHLLTGYVFTIQIFQYVLIILVSGGDLVDFLRYRVRICCASFIC